MKIKTIMFSVCALSALLGANLGMAVDVRDSNSAWSVNNTRSAASDEGYGDIDSGQSRWGSSLEDVSSIPQQWTSPTGVVWINEGEGVWLNIQTGDIISN